MRGREWGLGVGWWEKGGRGRVLGVVCWGRAGRACAVAARLGAVVAGRCGGLGGGC